MLVAALIAHELVAADPGRTERFAELYAALAQGRGSRGALMGEIETWRRLDHEAEAAEHARLDGAETAALRRRIREAARHAATTGHGRRTRSDIERAVDALHRPSLRVQAQVRRRLDAMDRLTAINAPPVMMANETRMLAEALSPLLGPPMSLSRDLDGPALLAEGLRCCVRSPIDGWRGTGPNLGVGLAPELAGELGVGAGPPHSRGAPESSWPALAALPWTLERRFHDRGPTFRSLPDRLDGCGPLGWATGGEVTRLADSLLDRGSRVAGIEAAVARVCEVAARGDAVIGCVSVHDEEPFAALATELSTSSFT